MASLTVKQKVGLEMLGEAREGEFGAAFQMLCKILGNIVASPAEPKFRKLRTSNDKIKNLLATKGVRALLVGSGFAEESDALNAEAADVATVQAGLEGLQQLQQQREAQAAQEKAVLLEQRNVQHKIDSDNREAMKMKIADDTAMRKEPGWKAHAAGSKDSSKSITSCADIGVGCNSGG